MHVLAHPHPVRRVVLTTFRRGRKRRFSLHAGSRPRYIIECPISSRSAPSSTCRPTSRVRWPRRARSPADAIIFDLEDFGRAREQVGGARGAARDARQALSVRGGGAHQRARHGMGDGGHPRHRGGGRRRHPGAEGGGAGAAPHRGGGLRPGRRARHDRHLGDDRDAQGAAAPARFGRACRRAGRAARRLRHRHQRPDAVDARQLAEDRAAYVPWFAQIVAAARAYGLA